VDVNPIDALLADLRARIDASHAREVELKAIVAAYEVLLGAAMSSPGSSRGPS
jgi:hypothetical protein